MAKLAKHSVLGILRAAQWQTTLYSVLQHLQYLLNSFSLQHIMEVVGRAFMSCWAVVEVAGRALLQQLVPELRDAAREGAFGNNRGMLQEGWSPTIEPVRRPLWTTGWGP